MIAFKQKKSFAEAQHVAVPVFFCWKNDMGSNDL